MAMEGTLDQQQPQLYLPRWKRNKKNAKSKNDTADVNDPCCPSADGYGEYRQKDQIERQSKEVTMLRNEQNEHAAQHLATAAAAASHKEQPFAPPSYNIQQSIWYYRDNTSGAVQGPFSGEQMMGWRPFFPMTTPVRFDQGGAFVALAEVDFVSPPVPVPPPPPPPDVMMAMPAYSVDNDASVENGVDTTLPESEVIMPPLTAEDDELKKPTNSEAESAEPLSRDGVDGPEGEMCFPPPSDDEGGDEDNDVGEDAEGPEVDACLPPPSDADFDGENDGDGGGEEVGMCLPPPSDDEQEEDQSEVPYPVVGEYPVPSEDAVPYPVDMEYPVDDDMYAYPNTSDAYDDNGPGEIMAAVAPYPNTDDVAFGATNDEQQSDGQGAMPPIEAKKKEFEGDKAVVGFVPSHLRVKRGVVAKKSTKKKPVTLKQAPPQGNDTEIKGGYMQAGRYSVADDYNKFMEEISELK